MAHLRPLLANERAGRPRLARSEPGVPASLSYPGVALDARPCEAAAGSRATPAPASPARGWPARGSTRASTASRPASRLGVRHGERNAPLLPTCPQDVSAHVAALRLGALVVPRDPRSTARAPPRRLAEVRAQALVVRATLPPPASTGRVAPSR